MEERENEGGRRREEGGRRREERGKRKEERGKEREVSEVTNESRLRESLIQSTKSVPRRASAEGRIWSGGMKGRYGY